ncbi:hypothetical protein QU755_15560 [Pseudomonas wenzhouensis]|nr:hypothetical protein [Pseudomonas wenzhouensis]MDM9652852.1 hypothetical protein [Pseudomonas wenzhouensis]
MIEQGIDTTINAGLDCGVQGSHGLPVLHFRVGSSLQHDPDQLGIPGLGHQHQRGLLLEVDPMRSAQAVAANFVIWAITWPKFWSTCRRASR